MSDHRRHDFGTLKEAPLPMAHAESDISVSDLPIGQWLSQTDEKITENYKDTFYNQPKAHTNSNGTLISLQSHESQHYQGFHPAMSYEICAR